MTKLITQADIDKLVIYFCEIETLPICAKLQAMFDALPSVDCEPVGYLIAKEHDIEFVKSISENDSLAYSTRAVYTTHQLRVYDIAKAVIAKLKGKE